MKEPGLSNTEYFDTLWYVEMVTIMQMLPAFKRIPNTYILKIPLNHLNLETFEVHEDLFEKHGGLS